MIASLVAVVTVPVTSTAVLISTNAVETLTLKPAALYQRAMEDRRRVRAQTRLYWNAIEQFQRKSQQGMDLEKPDINDSASIERVLSAVPEKKALAPQDAVTSETTDTLSSPDRLLLRRYTQAGFCPDSLKKFRIVGFYKLCRALVGEGVKKEPAIGLLNHNAYIRRSLRPAAPDLPAFKLRLQMIKEALDNGNRRDSGVLPARPTTCVMNLDCQNPRYSD